MSTSNKNKNGLLFIAGAVTGAAAAYYLNTPKGKELRKKITATSKEYADTLKSKASDITNDIKEKSISTLEKANEALGTVKSSLKEEVINKLDSAEESIDGFQAGVNKAKKKLKNGTVLS